MITEEQREKLEAAATLLRQSTEGPDPHFDDLIAFLRDLAKSPVPDGVRQLWEAATEHWHEVDEESGEPRPLGELLFDSSVALPGMSIKGKELYRIGCDLGLIEQVE